MPWYTKLGVCIYTSPSGYKVFDNGLYRWLTLDSDVLQTVLCKRNPANALLYYVPLLTLMPRTLPAPLCLLGLGGAGVLHQLVSYAIPATAIEISSEIINIATHYFMLNNIADLTVINQGAEHYLDECTQCYEHILVDIYNAHYFPPQCSTEHFFQQCANHLTSSGFLSVNLANSKEQLIVLNLIQKCFKNILIIPIKKCANIVIIACNNRKKDDFLNMITMNKEIKKIELVSLWGYVGHY